LKLSLKCRLYAAREHTPCSGTTDDGTGSPCEHWCHASTRSYPFLTTSPVPAIARLVAWNWGDEERDYNTGALEPGNSREYHIFRDLMQVQRWLETVHGYPHVEPRIAPDPRQAAALRERAQRFATLEWDVPEVLRRDRPWCIICGRRNTLLLRIDGQWACWRHVRLVATGKL